MLLVVLLLLLSMIIVVMRRRNEARHDLTRELHPIAGHRVNPLHGNCQMKCKNTSIRHSRIRRDAINGSMPCAPLAAGRNLITAFQRVWYLTGFPVV